MDRRTVSMKELLSYFPEGDIPCSDSINHDAEVPRGIANGFVPHHTVICNLNEALRKRTNCWQMRVEIHILWLKEDSSIKYAGLVMDMADNELYFAEIYPGGEEDGYSNFCPATVEQIREHARQYNDYLHDIADLYLKDKRQLSAHQLYVPFTQLYYYVEMPCDDRVVLCGVGLNDNRFWAVGWLGKLINKDLYIAYAECSPAVYEQLKRQNPSLFRRAQLLEHNRHLFSCYHVIHEKGKKRPAVRQIISSRTAEPKNPRRVLAFGAGTKGISIRGYDGNIYAWMEQLVNQCRRECLEG